MELSGMLRSASGCSNGGCIVAKGSFLAGDAAGSRALSAREVRRAVSELPGWRAHRYSRCLRGQWYVSTAAAAAGLVVAVEALAFELEVFPALHCTGRSVTLVLTDPQATAVTPAVLAFARRLSEVVGPPGRPQAIRTPAVVATVVRELASRALEVASLEEPSRVREIRADPVAEMMALLSSMEMTLEGFAPRLEEARAALALLLPGEEETDRRCEAGDLTPAMRLDRDAELLVTERLPPALALLRSVRQEHEAAGTKEKGRAERRPSLSDSTEDLTPYLRPTESGPTER